MCQYNYGLIASNNDCRSGLTGSPSLSCRALDLKGHFCISAALSKVSFAYMLLWIIRYFAHLLAA